MHGRTVQYISESQSSGTSLLIPLVTADERKSVHSILKPQASLTPVFVRTSCNLIPPPTPTPNPALPPPLRPLYPHPTSHSSSTLPVFTSSCAGLVIGYPHSSYAFVLLASYFADLFSIILPLSSHLPCLLYFYTSSCTWLAI